MSDDERIRLKALRLSGLLDSFDGPSFAPLMNMLAHYFKARACCLCAVSEHDVLVLANHGEIQATFPRNKALCSQTIMSDSTFLINDISDTQWVERGVQCGAEFKSYLGHPIHARDGERIGTLAVLDDKPRNWSEEDISFLTQAALLADAQISNHLSKNHFYHTDLEFLAALNRLGIHSDLFESISSTAKIGGWALDIESGQSFWSSQTRAIHEVDDDFEANLSKGLEFYTPDSRPIIEAAVERGIETGDPWDVELSIITAKGRIKHVRTWGRCEYLDGKPKWLAGVFQDVTEAYQRKAELQAARYSESRAKKNLSAYHEALETHSIVTITDSKGRVVFANKKFCNLSGYSQSELLGETLGKLNSHLHSHDFYLDMREKIKSGQSWHGEVCNRRKDGTLFWLETTIVPRLGLDGQPEEFVNICQDVTDWVTRRDEQEKRRMDAEDATTAKSRFLASMSHEIRTPLNGVVALAGALADTNLSAEQSEMVELIQKSGEGLNVILSDILDISRIEEGKFAIQSQPFNFTKSIHIVAGLMQLSIEERGLEFSVNVAPELDAVFKGDDVRIRQIVSNLLSNALKFTDRGRISLTCAIVDEADGLVRIRTSVEDTGVGMTSAEMARVFKRFEQGDDSLTRSHQGVGLGLWICSHLCESMQGRIWVESEIGKGSRFVFDLPLPRCGELPATMSGPGERVSVAGKRVLLAEDHAVNQRVFSLILQAAGFELEIVDNGQKAFDRWLAGDFEFVLMDLQMPRVDGLSAIRLIRNHERMFGCPRTPIAALSANALAEHRVASKDAGADMHIAKPVTPESLLTSIGELLHRPGPPSSGEEQKVGAVSS